MNNNYQNNNIRNTPPQINWWARFVAGGVSCMILSAGNNILNEYIYIYVNKSFKSNGCY